MNFGIVYGQQAFGLSSSLKIPRAEAQEMIDRYFAAYPGVRAFLDESVRLAHERGWAETMYGRKRHIREFQQRNRQLVAFGERTAMNHPMQGTGRRHHQDRDGARGAGACTRRASPPSSCCRSTTSWTSRSPRPRSRP